MSRERYYNHNSKRTSWGRIFVGLGIAYGLSHPSGVQEILPREVIGVRQIIDEIALAAIRGGDRLGTVVDDQQMSTSPIENREVVTDSSQGVVDTIQNGGCSNTIINNDGGIQYFDKRGNIHVSDQMQYVVDSTAASKLLCDFGVSNARVNIYWDPTISTEPGQAGIMIRPLPENGGFSTVVLNCQPNIMELVREEFQDRPSSGTKTDVQTCNVVLRHELGHVVEHETGRALAGRPDEEFADQVAYDSAQYNLIGPLPNSTKNSLASVGDGDGEHEVDKLSGYVSLSFAQLVEIYGNNFVQEQSTDDVPTLTELLGFGSSLKGGKPQDTTATGNTFAEVQATGSFDESACWQNPLQGASVSQIYEFGGSGNCSAYGFYTNCAHPGIDLMTLADTPIFPAWICGTSEVTQVFLNETPGTGPGYAAELKHVDTNGNTLLTRYYHFSNPPLVTPGQRISQSTQIGSVGSTGYSMSPHLHFEIFVSDSSQKFSGFYDSGISDISNRGGSGRIFANPRNYVSFQ